MADGLSIAAAVVGVAAAALQTVQFLCTTIDNIKDAPKAVKNVKADLRSLDPVLHNLESACRNDDQQIELSSEVIPAVENCKMACEDFQALLGRWMKHSTEDKTFWADRWRVGLFGQERIATFKGRLNDYKSTLTVALSTATIITTTRQAGIMQEMKDMMLKQNESVIHKELVRADNQSLEIESDLRQLTVVDSSASSGELEQSRQELIQEILKQQVSNNAFRNVCEEAHSRTVFERTGQKIKGIRASEDSTAVAGFINASAEESKIDQDISDVTAEKRSFAGAGVIKTLDFGALHSHVPSGRTDMPK